MKTLDKRLDKLEAIVDPKPSEPMIIYAHMTEAECAKYNKPPTKGNPLMVIVRPCTERGKEDEQS